MDKFQYTQDWYENTAHAELKDPGYKPNPENFHPERDKKCLQDLGVRPDHTILMLGCGGGDDIWILDKEFDCRKIIGVDWSHTAVDFCNRYFAWVTAYQANVADLPFPENMFDRVCALDVTEHLRFDFYLFALMEAYRVLKPGGRLAVLPGMTKRPEHINLLSLKLIVYHLIRLGFRIVKDTKEWIIAEKPIGYIIGEGMFEELGIDTPERLLFIGSGVTKPKKEWLDIPSIRTNNKTIGKYPDNPIYGFMTWPGGEPKGEGLKGIERALIQRECTIIDTPPGPHLFVFDNIQSEYAVLVRPVTARKSFWFCMKDQYRLPALKEYLDLCKRFKHAPRVSTGFYIILWLLYAPVKEIYISGYDGYKALSGKEPGLWDVKQKYKDCNDKVWCENDYNTIERNRKENIPDPCWYHNLTIEWMAIENAIAKAEARGVGVFVAKEQG